MTKAKMLSLSLFFFAIGYCMSSCKEKKELSKDKMIEVLHDINFSEAIFQNKSDRFATKDEKDALMRGILEKHHITQAQLDSSLVWYSDNPDVYNRVNDSVISILTKEFNNLKDSSLSTTTSSTSDTKALTTKYIPKYFYLTSAMPTLAFEIDSLNINYYPDFELQFKTMWTQDKIGAECSVYFSYSDTTIIKSVTLDSDTLYSLKKPSSDSWLENISGYFHVHEPDENLFILLYDINIMK